MALGADEVIANELEVSIEVFSRVLARILVPREDIKALIGDVRGDWRRMTRGLAKEATAVHDLRVAVPNLVTHSLRLGPRCPLLGATIATSCLREDYGVNVLAVTSDGDRQSPWRAGVSTGGCVVCDRPHRLGRRSDHLSTATARSITPANPCGVCGSDPAVPPAAVA